MPSAVVAVNVSALGNTLGLDHPRGRTPVYFWVRSSVWRMYASCAGNALALVDALNRETDIPAALRAWEPDRIQFGLHLRRQGKLLGDRLQKRSRNSNPPDEDPFGEVQQTVGDHRPAQLQHWGWPCRIWPTPPRRTLA
jgi:hypothetical protein